MKKREITTHYSGGFSNVFPYPFVIVAKSRILNVTWVVCAFVSSKQAKGFSIFQENTQKTEMLMQFK